MEFLAEPRFETPADRIIISLDEPWSNEKQFVRFRSRITPLFRNFVSQIFLHLLRGCFKSGNPFPRSLENLSILSFISNSLFFSWTRIINRLFSSLSDPMSFSLYFISNGKRARRGRFVISPVKKKKISPSRIFNDIRDSSYILRIYYQQSCNVISHHCQASGTQATTEKRLRSTSENVIIGGIRIDLTSRVNSSRRGSTTMRQWARNYATSSQFAINADSQGFVVDGSRRDPIHSSPFVACPNTGRKLSTAASINR